MKHELLMNLFQDLIDKDFRSGFEDNALTRAWRLLDANGFKGMEFWNDFCNVRYGDYKIPKLVEKYGQELVNKYLEIKEIENKEGRFEMPSWGTYGT
jgi:hypothetical protein